jgi:trk system potassium uptake protein TrkH
MPAQSESPANRTRTTLQRAAVRPWHIALKAARVRPGLDFSPLALVYLFVLLIAAGALVLSLPPCARDGHATRFVDALFTSTSAVCVTGLVVVDTGTHWSLFGQAVVLLLIQVGGLGFMASATLLLLAFGRRIGLRERLLVGETIGVSTPGGLVALVRRMALFALLAELAGALMLIPRFATDAGAWRGSWIALFQSVSAFNNAGFDVLGNLASLTQLRSDTVLVAVTGLLLILGGLSYVVLANLCRERRFSRLALDTKLVLVTTGVLLAVGSVVYLAGEGGNPDTLGPLSWPQKVLCAVFQSATPRTAGFTTVPVGQMHEYSLLFTMFLMFVGGASGSTSGGIKVNTFGILVVAVVSTIRGREHASAYGRESSVQHVYRALSVGLLSLGFVGLVILVLTITEGGGGLGVAFEAVSAFGTVGLSTGVTPTLSFAGRLIVVVTMLVGRLGPLYVALALVQRQRPREFRYPVESVRIG